MIKQYILRIYWVDTSYWDEGNTTYTDKQFASMNELNTWVRDHLNMPVLFNGQDGEVTHVLTNKDLEVIIKTEDHQSWYSIPACAPLVAEEIEERLITAIQFAQDTVAIKLVAKAYLGWSEELWREVWASAVKAAAARIT